MNIPEATQNISELQSELAAALEGEVLFDAYSRALYSTDASNFSMPPLGVVLPRHPDEINAIVEIGAKYGVPLIPRGSGTSMAGQALGHGLIVDFTRHLNQILNVDQEALTAEVQPGVVLATLNRHLEPSGLMIGPDPASADRATIGGMIGNNATGAHSIRFGLTIDHLLAAEVVLSDGMQTTFSAQDENQLRLKLASETFEGALYRLARELQTTAAGAVAQHWPRTWRRASGYSLNYLTGFTASSPSAWFDPQHQYPPTAGLNLTPLLCGSEGTLAMLRSATMRLVPRPAHTVLVIQPCDSVQAAADATLPALETNPDAVELLPKTLLERARAIPAYARKLGFLKEIPQALLVLEYSGDSAEQAAARAGAAQCGLLLAERDLQEDLWAVRKVGLGLLLSVPGDTKPITFIEDVAVPVDRLSEYVRRVDRILSEHGTFGEWYAHASAGCLHLRPMINLKTAHGVEQMRSIADSVVELVLDLGGSISGEHGDGLSHTEYNERLFGRELMGYFRRMKTSFDPDYLFNPGKVIPAENGFGGQGSLTANLRYGPEYHAYSPQTGFVFHREGSFAGAVESCTGLGVCRKEDGLMCPSYQATREESHSTRGRANALRSALSGILPPEALTEPSMYQILDLCLECKGCKAECPTAVDMARIKSSFLQLYYQRHGIPTRSRVFSELPALGRWAARVAELVNTVSHSRIFRMLQEPILGISRFRTFPRFKRDTFKRWYRSYAVPEFSREVVLFVDTYTNLIEPEIGRAAVQILAAAGYRVHVASGQGCCGRPLISKGRLSKARQLAETNLRALGSLARAGTPIIGLEPSCLLTLRDEYLDFYPDDPRARAIAEHSYLLEEFLVRSAADGQRPIDRVRFRSANGETLAVHNHCHSKALVGAGPLLEALRAAGYQADEIPSGCCGMAGAFGYEAEHYQLSMQIAEETLLPAAREAAAHGTKISTGGISCRTQIKDGAGIGAQHPAVLIAARLSGEER
jgi:FAD/FMN-containing dehydrogenase/Fe-S oxidoreductase